MFGGEDVGCGRCELVASMRGMYYLHLFTSVGCFLFFRENCVSPWMVAVTKRHFFSEMNSLSLPLEK